MLVYFVQAYDGQTTVTATSYQDTLNQANRIFKAVYDIVLLYDLR